jgi:hypothetical protein
MNTRMASEQPEDGAIAQYGKKLAERARSIAVATKAAADIAKGDAADDEAFLAWRNPLFARLIQLGFKAHGRALFDAFVEEFALPDEGWHLVLYTAWRERIRAAEGGCAND